MNFVLKKKIVLIGLEANATHIYQPLDVSFFKTFKLVWQQIWKEFTDNNMNLGIEKFQVAPLLKRTFDTMKIEKILQNGFKVCGLYPFDENAVDYSKVFEKEISSEPNV